MGRRRKFLKKYQKLAKNLFTNALEYGRIRLWKEDNHKPDSNRNEVNRYEKGR